jgi:beta-glucosidase
MCSQRLIGTLIALTTATFLGAGSLMAADADRIDERVRELLGRMTVAEKIGQMTQVNGAGGSIPDELAEAVRAGQIGSILNEVDVETVNRLQRLAVEESPNGIPLLMGRDVIHGFKTVLPIPLGQAATWNPELVRRGARVAALEAASTGVNWSFAPMIDVTRDPRWGRIAESFGEDPLLHSVFGVAMIEGFQGEHLSDHGSIAACAKHFAGYGASESGRDYNTTNIPENELRNVYLPPFKASVDAGVATIMASFSDLDGVPASANAFLMRQVLRDEWGFEGFVVSDWASIEQLSIHGLTANDRESAYAAVTAGVNMEMATSTYADHLPGLLQDGKVDIELIDEMVAPILRTKLEMGLFEDPYTDPASFPAVSNPDHLAVARELAEQSLVLLKNDARALPLDREKIKTLAVIGPLADDGYEQLGTWIFDGNPEISQTPLQALRGFLGDSVAIRHVRGLETTRSRDTAAFDEAYRAAAESDAVLVFVGEESILSGEAHSRADIGLPGAQLDLLRRLDEASKPVITVIMAGRPLTLGEAAEASDALLFAWHPGTMAGPAVTNILFGVQAPSGKLPVTFPRMVGQVPVYYAHKNTGKPATPETFRHIDDIPVRMPQTSSGFVSSHLDAGYTPLYPFGFGLSYTQFEYSDIRLGGERVPMGESVTVSATVQNVGEVEAEEVVQLYVRDPVANVTRPVRELKGFERIRLRPGERREVSFELTAADLAFYGRDMRLTTEPGQFHAWIGGDSTTDLQATFTLTE